MKAFAIYKSLNFEQVHIIHWNLTLAEIKSKGDWNSCSHYTTSHTISYLKQVILGASSLNIVYRSKHSAHFIIALNIQLPWVWVALDKKERTKKEIGKSQQCICQGKIEISLRSISLGSSSAQFPPAKWQHWENLDFTG